MTLRIFEKPSKLCGKCKELGKKCYCKCHEFPLFSGFHENSYFLNSSPVEDVTQFDDDGIIKNYDSS